MGSIVCEIELEGVGSCCDRQVGAILSQTVDSATPVDTPVVVSTELVLARHSVGSYLPAALGRVVGHLHIAAPVVEATDDADALNLGEGVAQFTSVEVDLVEACTWIRAVRAAIGSQTTTGGGTAYVLEVIVPIVGIGLELVLTVEIVETGILTKSA